MATAAALKQRLVDVKPRLTRVSNVVGVGIGGTSGSPHVVVMVSKDDEKTRESIAQIARGVPYEIVRTGEFKTLKR